MSSPDDRFRLSMGRLTTLLSYWTPPRFSAAASPLLQEATAGLGAVPERGGTVADQLAAVVQVLADVGADTEGQPRRPVPRAAEPAGMVDQLTVLGEDVVAAGPTAEDLGHLTERLDALRAAL